MNELTIRVYHVESTGWMESFPFDGTVEQAITYCEAKFFHCFKIFDKWNNKVFDGTWHRR